MVVGIGGFQMGVGWSVGTTLLPRFSLPLWTQSFPFSPRTETLKALVPHFSTETNNVQAYTICCSTSSSIWSHSICPRKLKMFRACRLRACKSQAFRVSPTVNIVFYSDVTVTRLNFFSIPLFLSISSMPFDLTFGLGELRKSLAHKASSVLI